RPAGQTTSGGAGSSGARAWPRTPATPCSAHPAGGARPGARPRLNRSSPNLGTESSDFPRLMRGKRGGLLPTGLSFWRDVEEREGAFLDGGELWVKGGGFGGGLVDGHGIASEGREIGEESAVAVAVWVVLGSLAGVVAARRV